MMIDFEILCFEFFFIQKFLSELDVTAGPVCHRIKALFNIYSESFTLILVVQLR